MNKAKPYNLNVFKKKKKKHYEKLYHFDKDSVTILAKLNYLLTFSHTKERKMEPHSPIIFQPSKGKEKQKGEGRGGGEGRVIAIKIICSD